MHIVISEKTSHYLAISLVLSVFLSVVCILLLHQTIPFIYDSVDDMANRDILFGNYTGSSDAHVPFVFYPLSWLLTIPFGLFPGFDWYGIFLLGLSWLSLTMVLFRVFDRPWKTGTKVFLTVMVILSFLAVWTRYLAVFLFTTTAALTGAVTLFWFFTIDFSGKRGRVYVELALTVVLALTVLCLRYEIFIMVAAMALVCFVFLMIRCPAVRSVLIKGLLLPLLAGAILFLILNARMYSHDGWDIYIKRENDRSLIFDYYGLPAYEENQAFYASIGFGEEEYEALRTNPLFIYDLLTPENIHAIAQKARDLDPLSGREHMVQSLLLTIDSQVQRTVMPLNLLHGLSWLVAIALVLKNRSRSQGWFCLAVAVIYLVLWIYLGYQGRVPERVLVSMHLMGLMTMTGFLFRHMPESVCVDNRIFGRFKKCLYGVLLAGLTVAAWMGVRNGAAVSRTFCDRVPQYRAIMEYCQAHPDNFYVIDLIALTEYTEYFYARTTPVDNYIKAGGPAVFTPSAMKKLERHGSKNFREAFLNNPHMYVISAGEHGLDYVRRMYAQRYPDFSCRLVDVIRWGANQSYVYQYGLDPDAPRPLDPALLERLSPHNNGHLAEYTLDGRDDTCWSSDGHQTAGMAFDIVLKETTLLSGIWLSTGDHYDDYPRALRIFATPDGENWSELTVQNAGGIYFSFDTTPVRQLRLLLDEGTEVPCNWSIAELTLYQ